LPSQKEGRPIFTKKEKKRSEPEKERKTHFFGFRREKAKSPWGLKAGSTKGKRRPDQKCPGLRSR